MTRLCRLCAERPVSPARLAAYDYRCNRCRHRTTAQQQASRRYLNTPKGKRRQHATNQRRIFVGAHYHSRAESVDKASALNAHIRNRRHAFIQGQSHRKETESVTSGGVPPEAAV